MATALKERLERTHEYRPEKLEAAILFFIDRANNGYLGKTKLMKLLYYADFDHVERYGVPITGAHYRKRPQGPVPDKAFELLDQMASDNDRRITVEPRGVGPHMQYRYQVLVEPDLHIFTPPERATLEQVVARWEYEPLSRIVAATHSEAPWLAVRMGEEIPYSLAHFRSSLNANLYAD